MTPIVTWGYRRFDGFLISKYSCCICFEGFVIINKCVYCMYIVRMVSQSAMLANGALESGGAKVNCFQKCGGHGSPGPPGSDALAISNAEINLKGYTLFRHDRINSVGGGVLLLCMNHCLLRV